MTVSRFFLDGFHDEEAYNELKDSPVFPLVRELEFKYGLKVLRKVDSRFQRDSGWQLVHKNGVAVCRVSTSMEGGKDHNQLEYCYRSPFYKKERGSSENDRETIRSIKVSSLMATLSRHGVVPTMESLANRNIGESSMARRIMRDKLGNSDKRQALSPDEVHGLLLKAFNKSSSSGSSAVVDLNKCQELLDKYEEADRLMQIKQQEVNRMFNNPFYMIGVDVSGDYLIGKYRLVGGGEDTNAYEAVETFKRYRSYEDVPELIPVMTMVKVAYEDKSNRTGVIPLMDGYDENLDAVFFYRSTPTYYDRAWMVTPC